MAHGDCEDRGERLSVTLSVLEAHSLASATTYSQAEPYLVVRLQFPTVCLEFKFSRCTSRHSPKQLKEHLHALELQACEHCCIMSLVLSTPMQAKGNGLAFRGTWPNIEGMRKKSNTRKA